MHVRKLDMRFVSLNTSLLKIISDFLAFNKKVCRKEGYDMAKNTKQTSRPIASKASKVLRDGRYSKTSKSVAGSALSQTRPKKK